MWPRILGVSSGLVPVGVPLGWLFRTGDDNPRLIHSFEGSSAHFNVPLQETWDFRPSFGIWGRSHENRASGLGHHVPASLKIGTHLSYPISQSVPENLAAPHKRLLTTGSISPFQYIDPHDEALLAPLLTGCRISLSNPLVYLLAGHSFGHPTGSTLPRNQ